MNDSFNKVHHVKVVYPYRATNNDELTLGKGDVIVVTQVIDGGWWEGTLNGKTAWFPSNYVKEIKPDPMSNKETPQSRVPDLVPSSNMQFYHNVVLHNVIETEKTHIHDVSNMLQKYIRPMRSKNILVNRDIVSIMDILEEYCSIKHTFLISLEDTARLVHSQRRIGAVFMKIAPKMRSLLEVYCSHHPAAIAHIQSKVDDVNAGMEELGAPSPGSLIFITCLSQPFTRLEKYSSLLKELERHAEESHIDRGDTQRAIAVYREISTSCFEIRKRKEMENEITSSVIKDWQGEDLNTFGHVLHISKSKVYSITTEGRTDHVLMLFHANLIILSVNPRSSGFHFERNIFLKDVQVQRCEEKDKHPYSFEIIFESGEKLIIGLGTQRDMVQWTEIIQQRINKLQTKTATTTPVTTVSPPTVLSPTPLTTSIVKPSYPPHLTSGQKARTWTMSCLCPAPPMRPVLNFNDTLPHRKSGNVRKKQDDPRMYEMDGIILRVIEAYCTSSKSRHTVGSSVFEAANIILPEEEKVIVEVENAEKNITVLEEKGLMETVLFLNDQVKNVVHEQKRLWNEIQEERKFRKILETSFRRLQKTCLAQLSNGDVGVG